MKILSENGRSMVEMLGVLAIIGILSIAGITGYNLAMAQHKANEAAYHAGIAFVQMEAAGLTGKQGDTNIDVPPRSAVEVVGTEEYPNSAIKIDFGNDKAACKRFKELYKGNQQYYVTIKNCE